MKKIIFIALLAAAVAAAIQSGLFPSFTGQEPEPPACAPTAVERGDVALKISGRGVLKPRQITGAAADGPGQVEEILVREGQVVKKGQNLIKVKALSSYGARYQEIRRQYTNAGARLAIAREAYEKQKQLFEAGIVSEQKVREARRAEEAAHREMDFVKERIQLFERETGFAFDAGAAAIDEVYAYITAPISGTVLAIHTVVGARVSPGGGPEVPPPLIVADLNRIVVEYEVSEIDVHKIAIGQAANIRLENRPQGVIAGKISSIASLASGHRRLLGGEGADDLVYFQVKIAMEQTVPGLKVGLPCHVDIILEKRENVLVIPVEAVARNEEGQFVFRVEEGDFARQKIETGLEDENRVEVTAGLSEGTTVCRNPLAVMEWEEQNQQRASRSFIDKWFD